MKILHYIILIGNGEYAAGLQEYPMVQLPWKMKEGRNKHDFHKLAEQLFREFFEFEQNDSIAIYDSGEVEEVTDSSGDDPSSLEPQQVSQPEPEQPLKQVRVTDFHPGVPLSPPWKQPEN